MRILQLIDTLHPGGAERMAVNYANSLLDYDCFSYLITTRNSGAFRELLDPEVQFLCLNRKRTFDLKALKTLRNFIEKNDIEIVHAHGTSWFLGTMLKLMGCSFKLIWHNHYGATIDISLPRKKLISIFSLYFDGVISVNTQLKKWADANLKVSNSICLHNFVSLKGTSVKEKSQKDLNIVCIANLKPVKNHRVLLETCDILALSRNFKLHLVGKGSGDDYSLRLKKEFEKRDYLHYHDSLIDPSLLLKKMDIGILCSNSEGLSVALLEYGASGLPVIATRVGANEKLLENCGMIIPVNDSKALLEALNSYLDHWEKAKEDAIRFQQKIISEFSSKSLVPKYLKFCRSL